VSGLLRNKHVFTQRIDFTIEAKLLSAIVAFRRA
jgi:hypothetical protein